MKKLALLSAVMTLGISSWAFAADNPPPPPAFHLLSADIDKLLPFFEKPRKKPAQRLA